MAVHIVHRHSDCAVITDYTKEVHDVFLKKFKKFIKKGKIDRLTQFKVWSKYAQVAWFVFNVRVWYRSDLSNVIQSRAEIQWITLTDLNINKILVCLQICLLVKTFLFFL